MSKCIILILAFSKISKMLIDLTLFLDIYDIKYFFINYLFKKINI